MKKKQKNRALKNRRHMIDPSELQPGIAAGLTQGASAEEAQQELGPIANVDGRDLVKYLKENKTAGGGRVPTPRFVGQTASTGFVRESAGRKLADARLVFPPDTFRAIREGMICLRCLEPQAFPFEDSHIEGCEGVLIHGPTYMKDRQILDIAMEFEGDAHIGPSKPMSELAEEQDARVEKRRFIKKIADGGMGHIPKSWLSDATLLEGLHPSEAAEIIRTAR